MEHPTYLIFAYMAIWAGLAGYLKWLDSRQQQIARRLETLTAQIVRQEDQL